MHCVLQLAPDPKAEAALARTMAAYEELARWLDEHVPEDHTANLVTLHRSWYDRARRETALPAQMITLALRDWVARRRREFPQGVPYDRKLFSVKGLEMVSLATAEGRLAVKCAVSGYVPHRLGPSPARLIRHRDGWEMKVEVPGELPTLTARRSAMSPDTVLTRVGRVITGLTNAAIERAEQANPVAVIEQAIREIDSAIEDVRADLGKATAEQHRVDLRLGELRTELAGLEDKVKTAVESKRDDLARVGVARQLDIEAQSEVLTKLRGETARRVDELEAMIDAIWASRREAEERLREYKRSAASTHGSATGTSGTSLDRATAKVERAQGLVERVTGVPGDPGKSDHRALEELEKLRRDRAIEERLSRIKSGTPS
jgi:phage shock protein A